VKISIHAVSFEFNVQTFSNIMPAAARSPHHRDSFAAGPRHADLRCRDMLNLLDRQHKTATFTLYTYFIDSSEPSTLMSEEASATITGALALLSERCTRTPFSQVALSRRRLAIDEHHGRLHIRVNTMAAICRRALHVRTSPVKLNAGASYWCWCRCRFACIT
jgi:hypothetical protein